MSSLLNRPITSLNLTVSPQSSDVLPLGRRDSASGASAVLGITFSTLVTSVAAAVGAPSASTPSLLRTLLLMGA